MFITFEGIEGSGKSTQIRKLVQWLDAQSIDYFTTLEPGGTEIGKELRQLLLGVPATIHSNRSELFLFAADRTEHLEQVVKPALAADQWVICDRYIDSTFAYQYGGRQHSRDDVLDIIRLTHAIDPDITFILDLSVEEGLRRAKERAVLDRFEEEDISFHQRVRDAYLECAKLYPERVCVIPSDDQTIDDIFANIVIEINSRR